MGVEGVFVAEPVSNYIGGIASFGTMLLTVMPILSGKKQKFKKCLESPGWYF